MINLQLMHDVQLLYDFLPSDYGICLRLLNYVLDWIGE